MGRIILMTLSGLALLTLLGEGLAAALLWSQGRLNADAVREIRSILRDTSSLEDGEDLGNETPSVSTEDVIATRAMRVLQIEEREREQELLTALIADARFNVIAEQTTLKAARDEFNRQHEELRKKRESEAIEQARAVLLKSEIDTAVKQLMELSIDESLLIIQGMPEKKIAELLGAFEAGDKEAQARGTEIFQAISRGDFDVSADAGTQEALQ